MQRTCQLEDFGGQIFQNGGGVHSSFGSYAHVVLRALFQVPMDTANGELAKR